MFYIDVLFKTNKSKHFICNCKHLINSLQQYYNQWIKNATSQIPRFLICTTTYPLAHYLFSTHYQTTNFRLFQTGRVCRRQFQIWRKWQKSIQTGRKRCGKRRNCSFRAISPFPTVFSKGLFAKGRQKVSLCGNGLRNRSIISKHSPSCFGISKMISCFFS